MTLSLLSSTADSSSTLFLLLHHQLLPLIVLILHLLHGDTPILHVGFGNLRTHNLTHAHQIVEFRLVLPQRLHRNTTSVTVCHCIPKGMRHIRQYGKGSFAHKPLHSTVSTIRITPGFYFRTLNTPENTMKRISNTFLDLEGKKASSGLLHDNQTLSSSLPLKRNKLEKHATKQTYASIGGSTLVRISSSIALAHLYSNDRN